MGNNTDRSYWLREFAGRAMQAYQSREGALCLPPGCPVEDAIAKWSTDQAEALLSAIERKERGGAHPNPPSDVEPCGCGGSLEIVETVIARKHGHHVSCSCGIMGPSTDTIHKCVLAWNRAMRRPASPPRALTEAEGAFVKWIDSMMRDGVRQLTVYTDLAAELRARRDDPTAALREAYRDACVAECEARRATPYDSSRDLDMEMACDAAKLALDAAQKGARRG